MSRSDVINLLYIVAFILFISGLRMLRGPRTAVRGNQVAAVGMAIAVVATLLQQDVGDWVLIVVGVAIGTAIGIPSARSVKMTQMPQMVALFNGVGGGAVALISIVEYREALRVLGQNPELSSLIPSLFAAIIGSISFWGSIIAFLKLQETLRRGFRIPRAVNAALALVAIGAVVLGITLLGDLPASDDTGLIGRDYDQATASAGAGLWFELIGGILAVVAGLLRVIRPDD